MDFLIHNFVGNELEIIIIITTSQIVLLIFFFVLFCEVSLCLVLVLTGVWGGNQCMYTWI